MNTRADTGQGGQALDEYTQRGVDLANQREILATQLAAMTEARDRGKASAADVETLTRELAVVEAQVRANELQRRGGAERARARAEAGRRAYLDVVDAWERDAMELATVTLPRLDAAIAEVVGLVRQVRGTLNVDSLRALDDSPLLERSRLLSALRTFDPIRTFDEVLERRLATVGLGSGSVSNVTRVDALQPVVEARVAHVARVARSYAPQIPADVPADERQEAER